MKKIFAGLILLIGISSCHEDKTTDLPEGKGVYIINEGNFNFGNGEVSFYNPGTKEVTNNLFHTANGFSLGDVCQSMFIKDSTGFIVVNNSAKIEVVRIPSFQRIRTIVVSGSSPRNFLPVNDSIAYISELYAKKIWVVNFITGTVVSNIPANGWTEKMILQNGNVFVEQKKVSTDNSTTNAVLKINAATNSIVDSKNFSGRDVSGMAADEHGNIWLVLDEDTLAGYKTSLLCFNQSLGLVKELPHLANGHHLSQLNIDITRSRVIYTDNDIYTINTSDTVLSNSVFIPLSGKNIYAISEDWKTGDIYLSDALDYVQQSHIYRYDKFGNEIHSFTAGIISGNFTFNND